MIRGLVAFGAGVLFAVGLGVSGMSRPSKVLAFLDVTGSWDPSLLFVMGVGLAVVAIAWRLAARMASPLLGGAFPPAPSKVIDGNLIGGSLVFGLGWGLVGFCPAPGLLAIASGAGWALAFAGAMLAGIALVSAFEHWRSTSDG